jgi:ATP-dependent HslUV protease, peptidase subunit HslV
MTCIIGIIDKENIFMGCDSRLSGGTNFVYNTNRSKLFKVKDFIIGIAGNVRYLNIIENNLYPRHHDYDLISMKYMCNEFTEDVRKCLEDNKYSKELDKISSVPDNNTMLIGYRNKLYGMTGDYAIVEYPDFYAIGSGSDFALGSLHTTAFFVDLSPTQRITKALESACKFDSACSEPFFIEKI